MCWLLWQSFPRYGRLPVLSLLVLAEPAMLDLDHPLTPHIFAASRALSAIGNAGHKITISARRERLRLRDQCADAFAELRRLSREHFADCPEIPPAIDELEQALSSLAELPGVPDDGPPAEDFCPVCGQSVKHRRARGLLPFLLSLMFPTPPLGIYCSQCLDVIMPSIYRLTSGETGFGTDDI
jgi:hypothetical protein